MISHSSRLVLLGSNGLIPMPRKMSGSAINRIDMLIVAISTPSVVFDRTTHLYRGLAVARAARSSRCCARSPVGELTAMVSCSQLGP